MLHESERPAPIARQGKLRDPAAGWAARTLRWTAWSLAALALSAFPALADPLSREELRALREAKARALHPHEPGRLEQIFAWLEQRAAPSQAAIDYEVPTRGLRPALAMLGPESGPGVRLSWLWSQALGGEVDFTASAGVSTRSYQDHGLKLELPRLWDKRLLLGSELRYRGWTQVPFYGLGPEARKAGRTSFLYEDLGFELTAALRLLPELKVGLKGALIDVNVGPGRRQSSPSTEELYSGAEAPGIGVQPGFFRQELFLDLDRRDSAYPESGSRVWLSLARYQDRDLDRYDFRRLSFEAQHHIKLNHGYQVLALRFLTSFSEPGDGAELPFYLASTLGGAGRLRGFEESRFRDNHLLLFSTEYRWCVWEPLFDLALFVDAGKVFPRSRDFGLNDLEAGYGVGFRLHGPERFVGRIDVGHSREGTVFHISIALPF